VGKQQLDAASSGIKIDTGHGPKPATVADLNLTLARIAVIRPENIKPADDEARQMVEQVRHEPETRRLVAMLVAQRHQQRRAPAIHVPQRSQREREPRPRAQSRRRAGSSRDGPDDPDLDPPPVALLRGFTAASERLSRHLQRRAASRYVA
jgi:hypothetical protein